MLGGAPQQEHSEPESKQQSQAPLASKYTVGDYAYQPLANVPRRIHILGTGSVGKLVAHSLRSLSQPPPVTLIFHKPGLITDWKNEKESINVTTDGVTEAKDGYDIELAFPPELEHGRVVRPNSFRPDSQSAEESNAETNTESTDDARLFRTVSSANRYESDEPIHNLIVCVKTWQTVSGLLAVRHRLSHNSTICFLQNGMGVRDEVNEKVFPNEATRPAYMFGIVSHGLHSDPQTKFSVTHAGFGTIQLGIMPQYKVITTPPPEPLTPDLGFLSDNASLDPVHATITSTADDNPPEKKEVIWSPSARYTIRTLTSSPVLCAVGLSPHDLHLAQLEKLAINSIINPLTVLLDGRNGMLLFNYALSRTMRLLLAETSLVLRSLPELRGTPNLRLRFGPDRLETLVVSACNATAQNVSSMLADVRAGRQTEIRYINGYVVRRGEEMGIRCAMNYLVMQMVEGKAQMTSREVRDETPMVGSEEREVREEKSKL